MPRPDRILGRASRSIRLVEYGFFSPSALNFRTDGGVNCSAMPNEIGMRRNELSEWSIDLVEINIGDESVDGGVDASRLRPMHVAIRRNKIRQHLQIRKSARVGSRRSVAADALVIVTLRIKFFRLAQRRFRQDRMLPAQRIAKRRPKPLILPA